MRISSFVMLSLLICSFISHTYIAQDYLYTRFVGHICHASDDLTCLGCSFIGVYMILYVILLYVLCSLVAQSSVAQDYLYNRFCKKCLPYGRGIHCSRLQFKLFVSPFVLHFHHSCCVPLQLQAIHHKIIDTSIIERNFSHTEHDLTLCSTTVFLFILCVCVMYHRFVLQPKLQLPRVFNYLCTSCVSMLAIQTEIPLFSWPQFNSYLCLHLLYYHRCSVVQPNLLSLRLVVPVLFLVFISKG